MTQKISPYKKSKMMALYFEGYSQSAIANKLNIDQSTVSLYVSKFKSLVDQQGIKAAGEEFDIMDTVDALHSLAAELKKSKTTVEEAKVGCKLDRLFQKLGVKQEDYPHLIQAANKMKSQGFIASAVKLSKMEESTGMTHEEIITQYTNVNQQLEKSQTRLKETAGKLDDAKNDLANIERKKKLATDDLAAYKEQIGVDEDRLKKVETLALALKKGDIDNQQLEKYVHRQQQLNEAGIGIDVFTEILDKAGVATANDKGKLLLDRLTEYGGLSQTNQALKLKIGALEKEAAGLEEKAALQGKIQADIDSLKAEKASLEPYVSELHAQKDELSKVKSEVEYLFEKRTEIEQEIANLECHKASLTEEKNSLEETTKDLEERKAEYDALSAALSGVKKKLTSENKRLQIFDSFLGLVKSSAVDKLETFAADATYFVEAVESGKSSPELVRSMLIQELTGGTLQVLACTQCEAMFVVDKKPIVTKNGHCPLCGSDYHVRVDKDALEILKSNLVELKHFQTIVIQPELINPGNKK